MLIAFVSVVGCSGNHGKLKTQSEGDSKVTQTENIIIFGSQAWGIAFCYHSLNSTTPKTAG